MRLRPALASEAEALHRRRFIALVGGAAATAAWPLVARAQQDGRVRRLGVLMNLEADDPESKRRIAAFDKALSDLGWTIGKTLRIDYRWGVAPEIVRKNAAELVALAPDVIFANAPPSVIALTEVTHTVPLVFAAVTDPVALHLVRSLAQPGGNATGFSPSELGLSAKWLELLKEIAPGLKRVAVFQDPRNPGGAPQFATIEAAGRSLAVDVSTIAVPDRGEMEREVEAFARSPDGGLIVLRTSEDVAARAAIIALAAQYRLPAVYPLRLFATDGGLLAYGPDIVDEFRQAAGYVDRILRGAKPADLPVQTATKFELVLNLKTAKALGLNFPQTLLATADEVIE
jgi:putative ABC transport system substrate-binding protein